MFFFNLSPAEFLFLLTGISSVTVALYLLDRSRRKHVVSSLRFWQQSDLPAQRKHRRKIQQPWSLLLQLLGIALLLLAVAQLRLGSRDRNSRDHVLLVDASSAMTARNGAGRPLLDEVRTSARRYIRALPSADRVMIVRADAMATSLTSFESSRPALETALAGISASPSALNLGLSLEFAGRVLRLHAKRPGEIVLAGANRISSEGIQDLPALPENLRLLAVDAELENVGFRKLGVRRAPQDPELWEAYVTIRNYGTRARTLPFQAAFGGAPVATRRVDLPPGVDVSAQFEFRTKVSGWIEVRVDARDAMPDDDRATLELPVEERLPVTVFSNEPELLKPVLAANRRLEIGYKKPAEYKADLKGIVVLDRFRPPTPPTTDAIWIQPPAAASPVTVKGEAQNAALRWRNDQPLAGGLRARDAKLESTSVFTAAAGDIPLAEVDGGPVILARPGERKTAVFGFHPMRSSLRYELATPIVFANVLRWMQPGLFRRIEIQAGSVGAVTVPLESDVDPATIRVLADNGLQLPFTIRDRQLRFFSPAPGTVRLTVGDRELVSSLNLPEVGEIRWQPPKTLRTGYRGVGGPESSARDIWQWLAIAGALVLLAEFLLFGRKAPQPGILRTMPWNRGDEERRKAS